MSRFPRVQFGRRGFLGALATPLALSLARTASAAPPDPEPRGAPRNGGGSDSAPERRDPDIEVIRALSFPIGLEPALIFRASPDGGP